MKTILKDEDLISVIELLERFKSICEQLDKLDSIRNPKDFDKHHAKYAKLVSRRDLISMRMWQVNFTRGIRWKLK